MGKSPETLAGKLLKVRENKARLAAAKQGLRLVKLKDGYDRPYMLFLPGHGGAWAPDDCHHGHWRADLAGLEAALLRRAKSVSAGDQLRLVPDR